MKSTCHTLLCLLCLITGLQCTAQEMRVTLLGTGSPAPSAERAGPATVVRAGDQTLLIDAGRNVVTRLWQKRIPVRDIDAVFLTHYHHDHLNGLADLWLTGWLGTDYGQRNSPMLLIGPEGVNNVAAGLETAYRRNKEIRTLDENLPAAGATFEAREFTAPETVYSQNGVTVQAFTVNHGELITPAVGYRIDYAGLSVVISGDTTFDERLIKAASGTDLLVHEVMAWDQQAMETIPTAAQIAAHHTTPEEAGRVFSRVRPKLAAYSHLVLRGTSDAQLTQRTRTTYNGPLAIGSDLMSFVITSDGVSIENP